VIRPQRTAARRDLCDSVRSRLPDRARSLVLSEHVGDGTDDVRAGVARVPGWH